MVAAPSFNRQQAISKESWALSFLVVSNFQDGLIPLCKIFIFRAGGVKNPNAGELNNSNLLAIQQ